MPTAASFSPRFVAAFTRLVKTEGGFVNDPHDAGGATKFGLSLRFLAAERKLDPHLCAELGLDDDALTASDVRGLTPAQAEGIYWRCFWQPLALNTYPIPLGEAMFDQAVNAGPIAAVKELQTALNRVLHTNLPIDGHFGAAARGALNAIVASPRGSTLPGLLAAYRSAAADRYRAIAAANPLQAHFLNGWLARAGRLGT